MANANQTVLEALEKAFQEVADRANRLREWMDLEPLLRNVDARFDELYAQTRRLDKAGFGPRSPELADLWSRAQETDLLDLEIFAGRVEYLNEGLPDDPGAKLGPVAEILALVQLGDKIQTELTNIEFDNMRARCSEFSRAIKALMADRRNTVTREVRELCELTIRLRKQVER